MVTAPISGEILGGFLYGPFIGVILATIGLTVGSVITFSQISRALGKPAVEGLNRIRYRTPAF